MATKLVKAIHAKTNINSSAIEQVIEALCSTIIEESFEGQTVKLPIGSFKVKTRKARNGFSPLTKQPIVIPEKTVLHFKPSKNASQEI